MDLYLRLDSVGAADYAMWSAGAYVIGGLTSPTYTTYSLRARWSIFAERSALQWKPPELALSPERHLGYCWAMAGARGTLGVALARTIVPQAVTVDHVAKPLLLQHTSAPKNVEFWVLPEPRRDPAPRYWAKVEESMTIATIAELLDTASALRRYKAAARFRTPFVLLANFTYDVHSSQPTQTFGFPPELNDMQLTTNTVLFRIRSNWGNDAYTCVYRVRVHGDATEDGDL